MAEWIATQKRCDDCANSRTIVSENGFHSVCCFSQKRAMDCFMGKKDYFVPCTPQKEVREND